MEWVARLHVEGFRTLVALWRSCREEFLVALKYGSYSVDDLNQID